MAEPAAGWRPTLCPYCGVGCGLLVRVKDGTVTRVKGDPAHPANFGDICAKAVHLPPVLRTWDRLLYPQLLPAAQWPEKDGVMTNSERRLTYLPKLVDPPGEALPDAVVMMRLAAEMGWKEAFAYPGSAEIFDEFAALTAGTACDYSGLSHARLAAEGPLQWPVPGPDHPGTARLYAGGRFATPDGRARFIAVEHDGPIEPPDAAFPLMLTTGRVRDHWHTLTRTAKSPALVSRTAEPILEVHPRDAQRARLRDGDFVEITSRRGKAVAQCRVSETIREGTCFLPFHWGRQFGFYKSANNLTLGARDPISQQPELKVCAARLRRLPELTP